MLPLYQPHISRLPELTLDSPVLNWQGGLLLRLTNWLGDALMTLPATWQLRQLLPPHCRLLALTPANLAPLWQACPWMDTVIPMAGKRTSPSERQQIRQLAPGAALILPNSFGAALDICRCQIPRRLGRRGRLRSLLLTDRFPEWKRQPGTALFHQLSYYLQLVSAFGSPQWSDRCPPLQTSLQPAAALGVIPQDNWTALAPGAAFGPAKQWPPEYYADIANSLTARGQNILILGTAHDQTAADIIKNACPQALDLTGKTSLTTLLSLLSACRRVLANDSGTMHLAAALGIPGVAVFGSTDPVATGPLGGRWLLRIATATCRPCFQRTCRWTDDRQYRCLREITPDAILQDLLDLDSLPATT